MTVEDLKEKLKEFPDSAEILLNPQYAEPIVFYYNEKLHSVEIF